MYMGRLYDESEYSKLKHDFHDVGQIPIQSYAYPTGAARV